MEKKHDLPFYQTQRNLFILWTWYSGQLIVSFRYMISVLASLGISTNVWKKSILSFYYLYFRQYHINARKSTVQMCPVYVPSSEILTIPCLYVVTLVQQEISSGTENSNGMLFIIVITGELEKKNGQVVKIQCH